MNNGSKIKKIVLISNLILNAILGLIIFKISNIVYRYNRTEIWIKQKESVTYFCEMLQQITPFLLMIWGALVVLSISLLILEFKKFNNIKYN